MSSIGQLTRRPDGAYAGSITIKSYGGKAFLQPIRGHAIGRAGMYAKRTKVEHRPRDADGRWP
jgi:hypothetical protein